MLDITDIDLCIVGKLLQRYEKHLCSIFPQILNVPLVTDSDIHVCLQLSFIKMYPYSENLL